MPTVREPRSPDEPEPATRPYRASQDSVYPPREDTLLLRPFAEVAPGTRLLEIGTGSGAIALTAARRGARVVATDRNPLALRLLARTARHERLDLAVVRTDLARGLGRFDRVLANPPYLPTRPEERDPDPWTNLALDGGADGCAVLARILDQLPDHLQPNGVAYLLTSSRQSATRRTQLWAEWRARGGALAPVAERRLEGERLEVIRFTGPTGRT
jgi:release factor glutamine methyltransferase